MLSTIYSILLIEIHWADFFEGASTGLGIGLLIVGIYYGIRYLRQRRQENQP